ncbi:hypothetical protein ACJU26_13310 [Acidithiobacillus sp. M4-SHS-6]|uniref:hypothetical protein n=1 Tax=Acidithiobacillus sp. M4-SHS-6 TaxID=3383024 RepID=UPI0039BDE8A0
MQDTTLRAIAESLNSNSEQLAFLHKLNDQEGETLAHLIAALEVHSAPERYSDTHWEDD